LIDQTAEADRHAHDAIDELVFVARCPGA